MKKIILIAASVLSIGFFTAVQAEEYMGMDSADSTTESVKTDSSGVELRVNFLGTSGSLRQDITVTDSSGNVVYAESFESDFTTTGFSALVGYGKESSDNSKSLFYYLGLGKETMTFDDDSTSDYTAFLFGAEGGIGNKTVKFIYGGEFGIGSIDTKVAELGSLTTFSAEPFIGLRVSPVDRLNINFRVGIRSILIEESTYSELGLTGTGENSAFTTNAQIGVGYSFY